jgi:hypothetical protein
VQRAPLTGVDNITGTASGDLYVAEDGGNLEIVMITPDEQVAVVMRLTGGAHDGSEIAGPAFDPSAERLYFSSQRGNRRGMTFEVTGPFRKPAAKPTPRPRRTRDPGAEPLPVSSSGGDGVPVAVTAGAAAAAAAAAAAGGRALSRRRRRGAGRPDG